MQSSSVPRQETFGAVGQSYPTAVQSQCISLRDNYKYVAYGCCISGKNK